MCEKDYNRKIIDFSDKLNYMLSLFLVIYLFMSQYNHLYSKFSEFWITIPIVMLIFGAFLTNLMASTYFDNPVLMTRGMPRNLLAQPFPAVTLCSPDLILSHKIPAFLDIL